MTSRGLLALTHQMKFHILGNNNNNNFKIDKDDNNTFGGKKGCGLAFLRKLSLCGNERLEFDNAFTERSKFIFKFYFSYFYFIYFIFIVLFDLLLLVPLVFPELERLDLFQTKIGQNDVSKIAGMIFCILVFYLLKYFIAAYKKHDTVTNVNINMGLIGMFCSCFSK